MAKKPSKQKLLTVAEYAASIGIEKSVIYKQVKQGKITCTDGVIDPERANAERAASVTKRQVAHRHATHATRTTPIEFPAPGSKAEFERAVARERAEKLRLENEVTRGVLVNAGEVESRMESRFRAEAEALLAWPSGVSAEMAAELGIPEHMMATALNRFVRAFMTERSKTPIQPAEEQKS
jgi:hypothetical protein